MESRLANEARRALVAATQKLTPEQRVEAFLVHSRLLAELCEAGRNMPPRTPAPKP